jgi:hypothetical protein
MFLKNKPYFLSILLFMGLMTSCLGNGDDFEELIDMKDAEIVSFSLSHDSVPQLASVLFSIDQKKNLIYNRDSMSYNTLIQEKVIVNYTSGAGVSNVLNITNGDSTWVSSGDSLDVLNPVKLRVYALDRVTTKEYTVRLNIHTINPDIPRYYKIVSGLAFLDTEDTKTISYNHTFFTYSRLNGELQLYASTDAINWQRENLSGLPENIVIKSILPNETGIYAYSQSGELYVCNDVNANVWRKVNTEYPVVSVLGFLNPGDNQVEGLGVVVEKEGEKIFAFTNNSSDWAYGETIPENFPLDFFLSQSYIHVRTGRITIVGGLSSEGIVQNAVWSTLNGLYWAKISIDSYSFPPIKGANAIYYDNEFWLFNGTLDDGSYNRAIYYSFDGGNTWRVKPEEFYFPEEYQQRDSASAIVDGDDKYFYIVGGKQTGLLSEIWKGFLNKKEFVD